MWALRGGRFGDSSTAARCVVAQLTAQSLWAQWRRDTVRTSLSAGAVPGTPARW